MKYLKFYEAFKSKGISNTLKFLREKLGKKSSDDFISSLKDFMNGVDFPIDQLSDSNIKYLSAKKAIQLRCESPVYNEKDIWVIKYWFSIEKGFSGTSWLSETIIAPFMVFQLISILKNASMVGIVKNELLTQILDKLDKHKGDRDVTE